MSIRGHYKTRQQQIILDHLKEHKDVDMTANGIWASLQEQGMEVGQTTVYRALERLAEEHDVMKVPSADGNRAQYRYVGESAPAASGKLVCLVCNKSYPLECRKLETLTQHIQSDHQFEIDPRYTVLYGYCPGCTAKNKNDHVSDRR